MVGNLLQTGNLAVLVLLHCFDEVRGIHQALVGPRVKPGEALPEQLHMQLVVLQIDPVQIGDLIFAAGGRLQAFGVLHDAVVVKIQAGHAVIALRMGGLFLDGDGAPLLVKFHDAEALGVVA